IASGSAAILEYACLTDPQVHDAAFVDQIVVDRLDEASVRGRALICARRTRHLAVARIDVPVALRRPFDAVSPVQAGVKPLRTIRRRNLQRQHAAGFIEERLRVGFAREVAALTAPVSPAAREA